MLAVWKSFLHWKEIVSQLPRKLRFGKWKSWSRSKSERKDANGIGEKGKATNLGKVWMKWDHQEAVPRRDRGEDRRRNAVNRKLTRKERCSQDNSSCKRQILNRVGLQYLLIGLRSLRPTTKSGGTPCKMGEPAASTDELRKCRPYRPSVAY